MVFVVFLAAAEAGAQLFCLYIDLPPPTSQPHSVVTSDPELGWVFHGKRHQGFLGLGDFWLHYNDWGMRGPDLGPVPQVGILLLGDSVTQGQHVPEEDTFAARLGAVNAGFGGYNTWQQRDRYRRDLWKLKPRIVGLIISANDIQTEKANHVYIQKTIKLNLHLRKKDIFEYEGFYRILKWIRGDLATRPPENEQAKENSSVSKDIGYLKYVEMTRKPELWNDWIRAILDIQQLTAKSTFFIALAPPRSQVAAYRAGKKLFWLNRELAAFSLRNNIPFLDLLPAMATLEPKEAFQDYVHFSSEGHKAAALALQSFIEKLRKRDD